MDNYSTETEEVQDDTEEGKAKSKAEETKRKLNKVWRCFRRAYQHKKDLLTHMQEDFEFALGAQWDEEAVNKLEKRGVKALTINKIKPIIQLIVGIESQNRTEPRVYPEGAEDSILAEVSTRLLKNVYKRSNFNFKLSEGFEDSTTGGEGWLEPFLSFTNSLHLGEMNWRKTNYYNVFVDPQSIEYDLSDAEYVDKVTYDMTEEQLISLYPDAEQVIKDTFKGNKYGGKINLETVGMDLDPQGAEMQREGYNKEDDNGDWKEGEEKTGDLLEHYYRKYVEKYFVLDMNMRNYKLVDDKTQAENFVKTATEHDPDPKNKPSAKVIRRLIPEIWVCAQIGNCPEMLYEGPAWSWPNWKSYPIVPIWCYRNTTPLRKSLRHLAVQGITRGLKDLNYELNKRRTQELLHINSSANSGWLVQKGAWVDKDRAEKLGATPGVTLEYKQGFDKPERIFPQPLSQGHAVLAEQAANDIRESSGINTDLLVMGEGGESGKAIHLRQKQGMVMVQVIFEHLSRSKEIGAKFQLSQLGEIFDVEEAMKVLGEAYLQQNFSEPVIMTDPLTGVQMPAMDPMTGQVQMQFNQQLAMETINKVLTDAEMGKFDVAMGEAVASETIKYANYLLLLEMAGQGVPIPPDVLVDESILPESTKQRIKEHFMSQQNAEAAQPASKSKSAKK